VAWEARVADPMVPLGFFRLRAFTVSGLVVNLVGFGLFGVIYFITLYFQNVKGYTAMQAGARTLPNTLMVVLVGPLAGRLNQRFGPRALMTVGMLAAGGALLGLSRLSVESSYLAVWPFFIVLGVGIAMTMPATTSAAMGAVDQDKAGIASGVVNAMRQVGGALGIAVLGSVGATLTTSAWNDRIASLPAGARAGAHRLTELVVGGQGRAAAHAAGAHGGAIQANALEAFVHGFRGAMLVGAGLMFAASLVAFVGLVGLRVRTAPQPAPAAENA
jgi:Na+/melibiose symporter-like transporter